MEIDIELNPLNALCFNAPLSFEGYQFEANNRFEHFTEQLDQQLYDLISNDFPELLKNLSQFHCLDLIGFKELILWFNIAIQNQECPNYIYDILYSYLVEVIYSDAYLEVSDQQVAILENSGLIPLALGHTFAGYAKFYESLKVVRLLGDFEQLIQRIKEVTLLVGALEYLEQNMVDVEYNRNNNFRVFGSNSKCSFCLKVLKKHDPQSYLVKSHVLSVREFHDPKVNDLVKTLSDAPECPGSGHPSIERDDYIVQSAILKHDSILLGLEEMLRSGESKTLRSARSAYKYIQTRRDDLMKYYRYYNKKAS